MVQKLFFFIFLTLSSLLTAQVGGKSTYQFLNLGISPRQVALGGKVVTNYDYDPTQALYNPASINPEMDNQLSLNYNNYLGDVSYGTACYAYLWDRRTQVLHAGITYINYGKFDGYDEQGNPTDSFGGGEVAVSFGHARNIAFTRFHIGGNVKFISSKLEQYTSMGVALDVALMYVYEDWDLNIALVGRNLGTQISPYDNTYERLPFELVFGISQTLQNIPIRWHFTLENLQTWNVAFANPNRDEIDLEGNSTSEKINFIDNTLRHMIVGIELFPESGFNIRLGYNFRRGEELRILEQRSFAGISAGFGIRLNKLRLSYAYSKYNSAAATSFFGLNINLQ
ncbi:MAG TPA: type IX secretion system protein PorQ [Flavobacteriaceae bacterium]|nr:type IX secretion system protein PorQ [Flavobacteriaceae bacterium]MCB9213348.1 type IX secretion system protein PorQ [Alteromonas sp.]HPF10240.1 type IX secretion system protein PorQ [Flavobacteriaceae bacterium]HQU20686.1 type IX secretion system protein PorQ [Flavobacteriaceae bacterium]HQU64896.1 type IX secretion system protein PorQ [Flavobacteriaceae bacterium]